MADFNISQEDLTSAITFTEQYLSTKLPEFDFSEGTANRDIAINSSAYIIAFFRSEIANIKNRQSLLKLKDISDDDSADEVVDEILSDWFLTRKTGSNSLGFVTLKFSRQDIGVVVINKTDLFSKSSVDFEVQADSVTIQSVDLVKNTDNLGVEFYTTSVSLISTTVGSDGDIDPGPFNEFPQVSPFLVSVENLEKFSGGKAIETSEEMVVRSDNAITVRDLNTIPSNKTVLTDTFSQVLEVSPIGMGDAEMQRDRIDIPRGTGDTISIHRGSKMDIYIKFPVEFNLAYATAFPSSGGLQAQAYTVNDVPITAVKLPDFPFYKIRGLKDRTVDPVVDVPYSIVVEDQNLWNSNRQNVYLSVNAAFNGTFLDIDYDTVTGYGAVQTFMESENNRIIVADGVAKASYALYLSFDLRYYQNDSAIDDLEAAKVILQEFIHGRSLGADFKVSEIGTTFTTAFPTNVVQLPFVVVGELLLPNGKILPMTFTDKIRAPDKYYYDELTPDILVPLFTGDTEPGDKIVVTLSDIQVSVKTTRYVVGTSDIQLTVV